jgi:hypothetical protein
MSEDWSLTEAYIAAIIDKMYNRYHIQPNEFPQGSNY